MTHDDIEELLGAYALDAVDGTEAEAVELHLRECVRCREEVAAHREVATLLAHSGGDAPAGLWERIAGELDSPAPPALLRLPDRAGGGGVDGGVAGPRRRDRWAMPALAVAAAVIAVLGFQVVRLDSRVDRLPAAVETRTVESAARAALLDPDSIRIRLASTAGGPSADAVVLPDGHGYLIMKDQQALPYDRTYQLWGVTPGGTVSLGVMGAAPNVVPFAAAGDLKALAVTVERAGGVVSSDQEPVLLGSVERA